MAALIALLGGFRATVFASVALVLLVAFGVQTCRLDNRTGERDQLQAEATLWQQANRDNLRAIGDLKLANEAWAGLAAAGAEKSKAAVAAVETENRRLAEELSAARRERGTIYATDPDAAAWGRTRVPARIADQLRR